MNVLYTSGDSDDGDAIPLAGTHGELISVSIVVDPHELEDLLDRLGQSRYPIDPQIYHHAHINDRAVTLVEFPAYAGWLDEINRLLDGGQAVTIRKCLTHAAASGAGAAPALN